MITKKCSSIQLYGRMVPAFKGLGYGMLFTSFLGDVYYAMILGWCIFYTVVGFTSELPWSVCGDDYNTYDCYSEFYQNPCNENNQGTERSSKSTYPS